MSIFRNKIIDDEWMAFIQRVSKMSRRDRDKLIKKALILNYEQGEGRKKGYAIRSDGECVPVFRYILQNR